MAIVTIFSGSYCNGEDVADGVANHLNYDRIEEKLLDETSGRFAVPKEKLVRAMTDSPPFFRLTRQREKNVAYLKAVLAGLIIRDDQLLHGYAMHLLPNSIAHVLKVCIIADHDYRVKQVVQTTTKSEKEADRIIRKDDKDRLQWTQYLFDKSPYDESLYDMVLPMQDISIEDAVKTICDYTHREPVKTTPQSLRAAQDHVLATAVNLALVEAGHDVEVYSESGNVTITINNYVVRLEQYRKKLMRIAAEVDGVKQVDTRIGPKYTPPSILPMGDFQMPSKILLVDDEKEFVHTLSERLQTRDLASSVVYDGEQALEFIERDEPDVMVLDLKMPGIDGIEVLRRVKRQYPNVEVIILTGHGSEREETLAAELGAFAYLRKPVDIDVLSKAMQEAYNKVNKSVGEREQSKGAPRYGDDDIDDIPV
ncbi:MAG TPA: response regulator [Bacteroidetes bacterium]|nr:response regulator [Bacteroidota bacterium]